MIFSSRIAALEKDLAARTEELASATSAQAALQTQVDDLTKANADCKAQFEADQTTIATLTQERDTATAKNTELSGKLEKTENSVDAKVVEKIAAAGVPPIARVVDTDPTPTGEKPGSGNQALTPKQRLAASFNERLAK